MDVVPWHDCRPRADLPADARPKGRMPEELIREMRTVVMIHLGHARDLVKYLATLSV
jgi:hypothetical protein